jgi:hypothetical protein
MKPGDRVVVHQWRAHGWEGRSGIVIDVKPKHYVIRFNDWSPTVVHWPKEDSQCLRVIA